TFNIFSTHIGPAEYRAASKRPFCLARLKSQKQTRFCFAKLGPDKRFCQSKTTYDILLTQKSDNAGWSSPVARQAHNLKAAGSNPAPATNDPCETLVPSRTRVFVFLLPEAAVLPISSSKPSCRPQTSGSRLD
ncbi:hypothetical protein ABIA23_004441, partial [Sinorhizobium fredii]